ncbi:hypothetical protein [Brachyspira sp. G79]|uniref:hypothetical protein n=1 Tax=Brachyspira sp. G79 TaxID=1358104 RepID=UPI000BBBE7C5|nr:hypothetical protein [Brachyspira sp. G79]
MKDIDSVYKKLDSVKKFRNTFSYRNGKKAPFNEIESDGTKIYAFHMFNIVTSLKNGSLSLHDEFYGVQADLIKTVFLLFKKIDIKRLNKLLSYL